MKPRNLVDSLLESRFEYDVRQRNGVMFSIPSELDPDAFIAAEMNLGAGPAMIWQRHVGKPGNHVLIYDIENPDFTAKFGQPSKPVPTDRQWRGDSGDLD